MCERNLAGPAHALGVRIPLLGLVLPACSQLIHQAAGAKAGVMQRLLTHGGAVVVLGVIAIAAAVHALQKARAEKTFAACYVGLKRKAVETTSVRRAQGGIELIEMLQHADSL